MKHVVITGAAGGVGSAIATHLKELGYSVTGIDRRALDETTFVLRTMDIREPEFAEVVSKADVVVHAAALLDLSLPYEELVEDNVIATQRVATLCEQNAVHLVHISDGCIYESGRGLRVESDPEIPRNDYERTKSEGEAAVRDRTNLFTILRPALVYGPGTESMSAGLVTLPPILRNFFRYVPGLSGGNRANWAHVDDIATAVQKVIETDEARGRTFNVADDTPLGFGEAITAIAEAYGFPLGAVFPFPNPTILTMFVPVVDRGYVESTLRVVLSGLWTRIVEKQKLTTPLRPKVDRSVLFFVSEDHVLDNSALKALGWEPKWRSFVDGIPDTIRWYQDKGWAPKYAENESDGPRAGYGLRFEHRFSGVFTNGNATRDVEFRLSTELRNVSRADLAGDANAVLEIDGWLNNVSSEGTADFAFVSRRRLSYQFGFDSGHGAHRFVLSTRFNPLRPISSLRRWKGSVTNDRGETVGELDLEIDFAGHAVAMLMSFSLLS